jgi:cytochrome c553|tara:strand:+ start:529 stop:1194 length:666 start_codon:yes stop_codon:yes gene_type:complete
MKLFLVFITSFTLIFNINAVENSSHAEDMPHGFKSGNVDKGSELVASCAACHGGDGNSMNSDWPKLAGQNQRYIYEQLQYFKDGERNNVLMMAVIPYLQSLKDDDLLDIAAFYSSKKSTVGKAKDDEELLALGASLYRSGDMKKAIPACTACHSVYGDGNSLAGFPSLAGQQVGYLVSTLKEYRSKERNAGEQALVMQSIAQNLNDEEIDALANYMHGLYK